jgi:LysR family glycine cleavage system transcriptional activator
VQENQPEVWRSWFRALGIAPRRLQGPRLGAVTTVLEAVHLDQGPGLFADMLIDERLTRGRLRAVVADAPELEPYVLVALKSRIEEPAIARFVAWIQHELGTGKWAPQVSTAV